MIRVRCPIPLVVAFALLLAGLTAGRAAGQYGPVLTGAGAVNRSMGGVATAAPLSPTGALYWNPATLTGFDRSEADFGAELLLLNTHLSSAYPAGAFGSGVPPVGLAGRTASDATVFPLPNAGMVYRTDDPRLALGLGMNAVAGFGVDYPGSASNPILSARAPAGVGVGPVYSNYQVFQINPAVAYQLTDRWSIGAGPNIDLATLQFAPGLFLPPDDANRDGFGTYPAATNTRTTWGAGYTVGLYYRGDAWSTGFSYKSPQRFKSFRYDAADETGAGRAGSVNLDLPRIVSWGVAYTGFDRWVLATDLRYLGYADARGFGNSGFTSNGAASGLGFRDQFAVATGAQYRATDRLTLRAGYSYGTNPIPDSQTAVNIASPTAVQHILSTGLSWAVTGDLAVSVAYLHGFNATITGPFQTALGAVPGTTVGSSVHFDSIAFGASVKFGPAVRPRRPATIPDSVDVPAAAVNAGAEGAAVAAANGGT